MLSMYIWEVRWKTWLCCSHAQSQFLHSCHRLASRHTEYTYYSNILYWNIHVSFCTTCVFLYNVSFCTTCATSTYLIPSAKEAETWWFYFCKRSLYGMKLQNHMNFVHLGAISRNLWDLRTAVTFTNSHVSQEKNKQQQMNICSELLELNHSQLHFMYKSWCYVSEFWTTLV